MLTTPYCEDISTEIMIHAWISLNDAEDIYDCLLSMVKDSDNRHYTVDVKEKLKVLRDRLEDKRR
jgi:hypothetical protein